MTNNVSGTTVDAKSVSELRRITGAGMMDCKWALGEAGGDREKAIELLRKKGKATADKKSGAATTEGRIGTYIHSNGKLGVLLELQCQTDFVARNEEFQALLKDLCMHIAGSPYPPISVAREEIPKEVLEKEREIYSESDEVKKKPENLRTKVVEGKVERFIKERTLLEQPFVKDETKTVRGLIEEKIARLRENIRVARFVRYEVGEKN